MDYLPILGQKWPHSRGNVGKYSLHGSFAIGNVFMFLRIFFLYVLCGNSLGTSSGDGIFRPTINPTRAREGVMGLFRGFYLLFVSRSRLHLKQVQTIGCAKFS